MREGPLVDGAHGAGGLRLDQVKMDRVEETGDFPAGDPGRGGVARLTDRQLDPGTLCPGRTVTATLPGGLRRGRHPGRVTLAAEAYDPNLRLLARQTATRSVVGAGGAPTSTPKPTATPPEPTERERAGRGGEHGRRRSRSRSYPADAAPPAPTVRSRRPAAFGVVQAAFLLGGLLLFLGVGLLLRLRHLTRAAAGDADEGDAPRWTGAGSARPSPTPGVGRTADRGPALGPAEHPTGPGTVVTSRTPGTRRSGPGSRAGLAVAQSVVVAGSSSCSPA